MVGKRALELGFTSTVGIIHDSSGQLRPIGQRERKVFLAMKNFEKKNFSQINYYQGRHREWPPQPLALPRGLAVSVYLRRRPGALLLAAAQLSRQAAGRIYGGRCSPRYLTEKSCAPMSPFRACGTSFRFLARPADHRKHRAGDDRA